MTKDGGREGGADDNQLRGEKGGEVGKASGGGRGTEEDGERRRELSSKSDSLLLLWI